MKPERAKAKGARPKAEAGLADAQVSLQTLFDTVDDLVFVLDQEGRGLHFNAACLSRTGYSAEELAGRMVLEFIPADCRQEAAVFLADAFAGKAVMTKIPLLHRDGARVSHETRVTQGKWGDQPALFCISRDASEREHAQQTLQMERDRLEMITENVGVGLSIISDGYRVVWTNQVLKRIYGEVVGKSCYGAYHRRTETCTDCPVRTVFETGCQEARTEHAGLDIQNQPYWVELIASPLRDAEGRVIAVLEVVVPISERKKMELALQESEARFRSLSESSFEGILFTDRGIILDANDAFAALYGYQVSELIGTNSLDLVTEESRKMIWNRIQGEIDGQYEAVGIRRSGVHFPIEVIARAAPYQGRPARVAAVRDLSGQRRLEAELKTLLARTISVQEKTRRSIAMDLHDGPLQSLTGVLIALESAQNRSRLDPTGAVGEYSPLPEELRKTIREIRELIGSLRPLSIEDGPLAPLLQLAARPFRKSVAIEIVVDRRIGDISLAGKALVVFYRILQEAFHNAVKHGKATRIRVSTGQEYEGWLSLRVKDDGAGFSAESAQDSFQGAVGLHFGLLDMRERAKLLGGDMRINSAPGAGAELLFNFPLNNLLNSASADPSL